MVLLASIVAVYLLAVFLTASVITMLYFLLPHECKLNLTPRHLPDRTQNPLPAFEESISTKLRRVSNEEDDCIVCRARSTEPVEVSPCGYVFSEQCIMAWFANAHQHRCPQWSQVLFVPTGRRTLERLVKSRAAFQVVASLLTVSNLLMAPLEASRLWKSIRSLAGWIGYFC